MCPESLDSGEQKPTSSHDVEEQTDLMFDWNMSSAILKWSVPCVLSAGSASERSLSCLMTTEATSPSPTALLCSPTRSCRCLWSPRLVSTKHRTHSLASSKPACLTCSEWGRGGWRAKWEALWWLNVCALQSLWAVWSKASAPACSSSPWWWESPLCSSADKRLAKCEYEQNHASSAARCPLNKWSITPKPAPATPDTTRRRTNQLSNHSPGGGATFVVVCLNMTEQWFKIL